MIFTVDCRCARAGDAAGAALFRREGVRRCDIDTAVAGVYTITFGVRNSARLASAVATRTVTVAAT